MYSFSSFWRTFETLFISLIGSNFPDIIIDTYLINKFYVPFIYLFKFFSNVFIFGVFAGSFAGTFLEIYKFNLRETLSEYPKLQIPLEAEVSKNFYDEKGYE